MLRKVCQKSWLLSFQISIRFAVDLAYRSIFRTVFSRFSLICKCLIISDIQKQRNVSKKRPYFFLRMYGRFFEKQDGITNLPNIHCATIYKLSQWKKNKMQRKFTFLTYGVIRIIYNLNIFPISYSYVV